ncbi:MAG: hypothetical protein JW704_13265 [Anaerolineaceae bacterium]|nr:hypothetical protein [Anaerolineaceae bacterium]
MKELELLKEAMRVYGLSPELAAAYIGADGRTVRRWLDGDNEPTMIFRQAIVAGVEKMKAKFEPMIGAKGGVWWGSLSGEPKELTPETAAAIETEKRAHAELHELFDRAAKEIKTTGEWAVFKEAWPGFAEVVIFLRQHKITFGI